MIQGVFEIIGPATRLGSGLGEDSGLGGLTDLGLLEIVGQLREKGLGGVNDLRRL